MVKVVAIGGGTGLPNVLRALDKLDCEAAAVVNVVDDGGSSGRLRKSLNILPPGDARNCLNATATNEKLSEIFDFRFDCDCELDGHNIGNLIIAALAKKNDDFYKALNDAKELLGSRIEVFPATNEAITLYGYDSNGRRIDGQKNISNTIGIRDVKLVPQNPKAFDSALTKIRNASVVLIGPGSLYSSILPALLVPEIRKEISSHKNVVYICNTVSYRKETRGYSANDHIEALYRHIPELKISKVVLQDDEIIKRSRARFGETIKTVDVDVRKEKFEIIAGDMANEDDPRQHSPEKLANLLSRIINCGEEPYRRYVVQR